MDMMTQAIDDSLFTALGLGLLTFVRVVGMMIQAPIFGSRHYNTKIRVGFAAAVTLVAFPNLPIPPDYPDNLLAFILAIMSQLGVGLVIGFVSFKVMAAAQFGGEILDIQMGLSVAATMDPSTGGTTKIIQRLSFYLAMLFYLVVDGHHELMRVVFDSFYIVPLSHFVVGDALAEQFIALTYYVFVLGLRLAAPGLAALFLTQVALGLLARVAPQMNVFMLSFPLNIAIGLFMIYASMEASQGVLRGEFAINIDQIYDALHFVWDG